MTTNPNITGIELTRTIARVDRILPHLEKATHQLDGKGGTIEEMSQAVRTSYELLLNLRQSLTP